MKSIVKLTISANYGNIFMVHLNFCVDLKGGKFVVQNSDNKIKQSK